MPTSSIVKRQQQQQQQTPSNQSNLQQSMKIKIQEEEEEDCSEISDTELQLVKILNTFTKGKGKEHGGLSFDEYKVIEKAIPWVILTYMIK